MTASAFAGGFHCVLQMLQTACSQTAQKNGQMKIAPHRAFLSVENVASR